MRRSFPAVVLCGGLAVVAAGPGCGKRGDPLPPVDRTPQPVTDLSLAQRGDQVEVHFAAPRATVEGDRLPVLEVELWRADTDGVDVQEYKRLKVAPGERLVETEPLPPPGTTLRYAARARVGRDLSPYTRVLALKVQEPPAIPQDFEAELRADGVILSWTPPPLPEWLTKPEPAEAEGPKPEPAEAEGPKPEPAEKEVPKPEPAETKVPKPEPAETEVPQEGEALAPSSRPPATATRSPADDVATSPPTVDEVGLATTPAGAASVSSGEKEPPAEKGQDGERPAPGEGPQKPAAAVKPTPEPFRGGVNVYRRSGFAGYSRPLNPTPISIDEYLDADPPMNAEACYVLRTIVSTDPVVESAASQELCVQVRDIVAPAAPVGVAVRILDDRLEITWSASGEADLVSYRVYRRERDAPAEPIADVPAGTTVLYDARPTEPGALVYTVTAIDKAGNESPPSAPAPVRLP